VCLEPQTLPWFAHWRRNEGGRLASRTYKLPALRSEPCSDRKRSDLTNTTCESASVAGPRGSGARGASPASRPASVRCGSRGPVSPRRRSRRLRSRPPPSPPRRRRRLPPSSESSSRRARRCIAEADSPTRRDTSASFASARSRRRSSSRRSWRVSRSRRRRPGRRTPARPRCSGSSPCRSDSEATSRIRSSRT